MNKILDPFKDLKENRQFVSSWNSPANIAFVKYWGKKGHQLPANPSLSMTLDKCKTITKTSFSTSDKLSVELKRDGVTDEKFASKIIGFLDGLKKDLPFLTKLKIEIETSNTFPHGAGIASSASGLSAFALTLIDYMYFLSGEEKNEIFFSRASYLSRLASGSASRSIYGGFVCWGDSYLPETTDHYATPFTVHPQLTKLKDAILVVSSEEKNVSSSAGHGKMKEHYFAEARFNQARAHFSECTQALKAGDFEVVGKILEAEALSLHAMMLTSPEAYTLLKPNTLAAIEVLWRFRRETKLPIYFTLDAGPNLHLIYPDSYKNKIDLFINTELKTFTETIIFDQTGGGPLPC